MKEYKEIELEIIRFETDDVITESNPDIHDGGAGD